MKRQRTDQRRDRTRLGLIEAAEALFATRGVNGVSLREIANAAGSANQSVIQYYFGGKDGLIEAIFLHRLEALEQKRAILLADLKRQGRTADVHALLVAQFHPLTQQRDASGRRSYAAFVAGLHRFNESEVRIDQVSIPTPATDEIAALLRRGISQVPPLVLARRLRLVFMLICDALNQLDGHSDFAAESDEKILADVFRMAAAAMQAPEDR